MLADDALGAKREADPNNELVVGELDGTAVAVLQLTFIPNISRRGSWRAQIEGVRVDSSLRSSGVGRSLIAWAIERARNRGCSLVQLTSDKSRSDAIRFYESLGFVASHEGMKLELSPSP